MKYEYTKNGDELRFKYCPICEKEKDNPDFAINIKDGVYYCFANDKGGSVEELGRYGFDIKNIPELSGGTDKSSLRVGKKGKSKKDIDLSPVFLERKNDYLGEDWIKYLASRGISDKHLKKFARLGKNNSMMIPLTDGKKVVGIKYRTMDKKIYSEKESLTDYLMNWQQVKDFSSVIIVEGEIDLLSSVEVGVENVVSLPFGAGNLKAIEHQKEWLARFEKIIIATDNDTQGKKSKEEICKILSFVKSKLFEVNLEEYKDFNEVLVGAGKDKLRDIINSATNIKDEVISPFTKGEDGYYYNLTSKITDFVIEVENFSDNYIFGKVFSNGREREFFAKKIDLLTKNGILENLGYFLGTNNIIPNFWSWIMEINQDKYIEEIEHYGIIDNKYYDPKSHIICGKNDLKIKPLEEIGDFTGMEKYWLNENLLKLRKDPMQSLLGVCWALGRFHIEGSYPILEVSGTTSIGKTEFVEFISRILFGTKENIKSLATLTKHQIRSLSSCSNITPYVIDEVKILGRYQKERAMDLYSTIRCVYDNKTINQGNTTSKLTEFKLCTPLIISGESEISDVSIKNRMVSVDLSKENKCDKEVFRIFKTTDYLEKLGKIALEDRLENGKVDYSLKETRFRLQNVDDERQLHNGRCILTGLMALERLMPLQEEIMEDFYKFLDKKLSNFYTPTKNFLELLELVRDSGKDIGSFYQIKGDRHFVRFSLLYKAIREEWELTNSTLELLDMKTLRKQLIEERFIIDESISRRFPKNEFSLETTCVRCCEIIKNDIFIKDFFDED